MSLTARRLFEVPCGSLAMQVGTRAEDEAMDGILEQRQDVWHSPCDSLELSDDSDNNTNSQAESDLSLPLSTHERQDGNQHEDVLVHNTKTGDLINRQELWRERLKKAAFHLSDESGNQHEDNNQIDESSSHHSIIESELSPARDDSSLSLSKSSSSEFEADEPIPWLDSEHSEPSSCDGDAARAVLIASDEEQIARASSSSDARWLFDSSSQCSAAFEPQWVEDEDQVEEEGVYLWEDFDAALRNHLELNQPKIVVDQTIVDDEAYDASVSASSLDDSDDESTGYEYPRSQSLQSFHPRLSVGYDTSSNVDSLASLPSSPSDKTNSSVSSLEVLFPEEQMHPPDPLLDPLSSSCDENPHTKGSRWIENIPPATHISILGSTPFRELPDASELPRYWRQDQFVVAEEYGMRQPRRRRGIPTDTKSVESLSDDEEDTPTLSPTVRHHPQQQLRQRHYSDLHEVDGYVGYSDLAGMFDLHAPRYPAVIVDLGCGTSRLCAELVFHGHRFVYGVDCDPMVVDFQRHCSAAADLMDFVRFLPMNADSLAFPDESSDFIVSKAMFDEIATRSLREKHPQELLQALKEAIRCLKTGGVLMVVAFQDQHSVDGDGVGQFVLPNDASPIERASFRLQTPWWRWVEVETLFKEELTLIAQYELGCPTQRDGPKTKPYCALVWRRKENNTQRLRRLAGRIRVQKRMEREYEARIQLLNGKVLRGFDERKMVKESRLMIVEDEQAGRLRMTETQAAEVKKRIVRRSAFYAALLEEERQTMTLEDAASTMRREWETRAVAVVTEMIAQIIDAVFVAVPAAPVAAAPPVGTAVSLEPVSKAKSMQQPSTPDTNAASTADMSDNAWIRDEMLKMVDAALAAVATKELQKPVQRRRRVRHTTQATVEPASTTDPMKEIQVIKPFTSADVMVADKASATPPIEAATDPHDVAQHTVSWIVSRAMASITQVNGHSSIPDLEVIQPDKTPNEPTSSVNPTEPGAVSPEPEYCPTTPPASLHPPEEQHSIEKAALNPVATTTPMNGEIPSSDGDGEALLVCEAVLDAIVGQVSQVQVGQAIM